MRYSVNTASTNYFKVLEDKPIKKDDEIERLKKENDNFQARILEFDHKLKTYEPGTKIYNKKRRHALYNLNVKKVEPRSETLNTYDIKYVCEK